MTVCGACFHACRLKEGAVGRCRARQNQGGKIQALNYGKVVSVALDPIEKKPLMHFYPGKKILSLGSFGCNLHCSFCQNYRISQSCQDDVPWEQVAPEDMVKLALSLRERGNIGLAYTYNEPLVGYEFVRDCARLAKESGLMNVLVTNGCFKDEVIDAILPYVDAFNVDLKGFSREVYEFMGGNLDDVKHFLERVSEKHLEVTMLIIPGLHDDDQEMETAFRFLASLSKDTVLHLSRFFPAYRMYDRAPTSRKRIDELAVLAGTYLNHVYKGNY